MARKTEREALQGSLDAVSSLTTEAFLERYPSSFAPAPTYDVAAGTIAGLAAIQGSSFALDAAELERLGAQGFVITDRKRYPTFTYGYATIYMEDLPVYVSADSILHSIHRSYDDLLKGIETEVLMPDLGALLGGMRDRLASAPGAALPAGARKDADLYLTVAASLLADETLAPADGSNAAEVAALVSAARAAEGMRTVVLFGSEREEDFSQFKPRGHYDDAAVQGTLHRYFKAMMWLGRTDLRLIETQPDGSQLFRRRQLEASLALRELVGSAERARFDRVDRVVTAFVGEHDYMRLAELDALLADLGVSSLADVGALSDQRVAQAIVDGGYGEQRISSHIMVHGPEAEGTLPLSSSFAFLGQRYVLDSHVFSNVVFDRVKDGQVMRMMPNPLDVAFAALENDHAAQLLAGELAQYPYAPELAAMRVGADAHPPDFWGANLYNLWLSALRTLSPDAASLGDAASGLPPVARSEAWSRRLLSTQLASWAELRHDTLLYAKQSYTGAASCEFPDAYVDPYPEFYSSVGSYAEKGRELVDALGLPGAFVEQARTYFSRLSDVALRLRDMAEHERSGAPFTPEMLAFINQAVKLQPGCGEPTGADGWYATLFLDGPSSIEVEPTIADVHTQPTDETGNPVGRVLHVATGAARPLVVVVDGCGGPRAYAGLASSYFEKTTENFARLTDEEWATEAPSASDPAWLGGVVLGD